MHHEANTNYLNLKKSLPIHKIHREYKSFLYLVKEVKLSHTWRTDSTVVQHLTDVLKAPSLSPLYHQEKET